MSELQNQARQRREVSIRCVLDTLRHTIAVVPLEYEGELRPHRVEMTDASARVIAPLLEAVEILEEMIWASDGCVGHRQCAHSMEPWQRARALLDGKWSAYPMREWPTATLGDCIGCDGYILAASEAPYCPTCARLKAEGKAL